MHTSSQYPGLPPLTSWMGKGACRSGVGAALPLHPVCPEQVAPARHLLLGPSRAALQPEDAELGGGAFVCCLRVSDRL